MKNKLLSGLFPEQRMKTEFPWYVWCTGWLAILKGIVWLLTDPAFPSQIIGYKYLIYMVPLILCGTGIWNLKKIAVRGIIILCIAEIPLFIMYPVALNALMQQHIFFISKVSSLLLFIINGPPASVFILCTSPFILKYIK